MQYIMFLVGIIFTIILLKQFGIENKKDTEKKAKDVIKRVVIYTLFISCVLETTVFNFKAFEILGKDYPREELTFNTNKAYNDGKNNVQIIEDMGGEENTYIISLADLNQKVKSIDIAPKTNNNIIKCSISYTDDALTQESSVAKGEIPLLSGNDSYNHITTNFAGKVHSLKFRIVSEQLIDSVDIKLNHTARFEFNFIRFLVVNIFLAIVLICVSYRGRKESVFGTNTRTKICMAVFAFLQIIIVTVITFEMNVDTSRNVSVNDFRIFDEYTNYNDVYNEMAVAFSKGQIHLNGLNAINVQRENEGIAKLMELENPYIWTERDNIDYKWDHAFYNGKYYSYFGVVPELTTYLPAYIFTGKQINTKFVNYIYMVLIIILITMFVYNLVKRWKDKLSIPIVISAAAAMVNGSMLLYCLLGSKFYEIATLSAVAFSLLGLNFILTACASKKIDNTRLCIGALAMALAVGCRPNFALISFLILPIIIPALIRQSGCNKNWVKGIFNRKNIHSILVIVFPYLIVGACLMAYNYARFDSITEFGARYQLTVYDTSYYSILDFGKLSMIIGQCLLLIPTFTNKFPFVNAIGYSPNYMGYCYQMSYFGIFAYPFCWLLAMLPWSLKRGIKRSKLRGFTIVTTVMAFVMCYATATMGGISLRYAADYGWLFFVPVILVAFDLYGTAVRRKIGKYVTALIIVFAAATVIMNLMLFISPETNSLSTHNPKFFYWLEQTIVFWKA